MIGGADYAASNLRILAENISAYASYAREEIDDPFGDLFDEVEKAQQAVKDLVVWIESHKKERE